MEARSFTALARTFALALVAFIVAGHALAQGAFPTRPIRLIVPYPAGGPIDLLARIVGQKLGEGLRQPVIVDNRGGANGLIGCEAAAKAPPDGYTLLMASTSTHSINPAMYRSLPYDAQRDFAPVAMLDTRPYVLVVHPAVAADSVTQLIALAKSKPGKLTYASGGGVGSANHLAAEMFKTAAGVDILHVPYKGGGPALNDVLAGQVDVFFAPVTTALPFVQAGRLRALAVTGDKRSAVASTLPTLSEAGIPGFEFSVWDGIVAPANTPADIVARLNAEVAKVLQAPETRDKFASMGADLSIRTAEQLGALMKADFARWAKMLKDAGVQPE